MQLLSAVELCSCSSAETPPHATAGPDAASVPSSSLKPRKSRVFSTSWNTSSARPITLAAQQRITEETKGCSLLEHTRTTTACLGHSALLLFLLLKIAGLLASTVDSARSRFGYRSSWPSTGQFTRQDHVYRGNSPPDLRKQSIEAKTHTNKQNNTRNTLSRQANLKKKILKRKVY